MSLNHFDFSIKESSIINGITIIDGTINKDLRGVIYTSYQKNLFDHFLPENLKFHHDKFTISKKGVFIKKMWAKFFEENKFDVKIMGLDAMPIFLFKKNNQLNKTLTNMREIIIDTETTGLDYKKGDKIIEVACVELINHITTNNHLQFYCSTDRTIDENIRLIK